MGSFRTPILFLIFNRPDVTQIVFNTIKEIRPSSFFIAADGPRESKEHEAELCRKTREIVDRGIDWDCKVHKLYRDKNLGCGEAVSGAISWFFDHVEEGIILEDDTLPDETFFPYCEELLIRYRTSGEIMMISGDNFRLRDNKVSASYTFTKYCNVWGWATWRRAWGLYDFEMKDWPESREKGLLKTIFKNKYEVEYWTGYFDKTYHGLEDTWDYQWHYACLKLGGLAIEPAVNLVTNIGFREDATHTTAGPDNYLFANVPTGKLIVEQHPRKIKRDTSGDAVTFVNRFLNGDVSRQSHNSLASVMINNLSRFKRFLFPNTPFRIKERLIKAKRLVSSLVGRRG